MRDFARYGLQNLYRSQNPCVTWVLTLQHSCVMCERKMALKRHFSCLSCIGVAGAEPLRLPPRKLGRVYKGDGLRTRCPGGSGAFSPSTHENLLCLGAQYSRVWSISRMTRFDSASPKMDSEQFGQKSPVTALITMVSPLYV